MKYRSKLYKSKLESIDKTKVYSLEEGIDTMLSLKKGAFDESVELHLVVNLKGTKGPQSVRGSVLLPKPVAKTKRVIVLTDNEEKSSQAKLAGADLVGGKEIIEEIKKNGGIEADIIIATPNFMKLLAPVAKILGPKGLMPSPKNGTTTEDVSKIVKEFKAGKAEFRMDKTGIIHQSIGKVSFTKEEILANIKEFVSEVDKNKPEKVKGDMIKLAYLTLTQSPSIKVKL